MARFAAFLRGINVGGHRITKDELRVACEAVGLQDVATFRASGNVIFSAKDGEDADAIVDRIETGLAGTLGYEVPVFLRTAAEVSEIAAHQPFEATLVERSAGKVQVSLLTTTPSAQAEKAVLGLGSEQDPLAIHKRELYWLPSGGMLES